MGLKPTAITPDNTQFVVLSFEGPDRYSAAGGLGVRVSNLCQSLAATGSTGEDYAIPYRNAIVMETADPKEIETYITYLDKHPEEKHKIRQAGRGTARQYVWEKVIKNLIRKLEYQARLQGLLALTEISHINSQ